MRLTLDSRLTILPAELFQDCLIAFGFQFVPLDNFPGQREEGRVVRVEKGPQRLGTEAHREDNSSVRVVDAIGRGRGGGGAGFMGLGGMGSTLRTLF